MSKTFKDYLLEGGVKGRYFSSRETFSGNYRFSGNHRVAIKIIDLVAGRGSDAVHFQLPNGRIGSMNYESAYVLKEATPSQVASFRAKESKLAAKV